MSVTSTTAAVSHTGNGVADTFAFTFKVFADTDLYVTRYTIADGTLTALTLTTDYTVSLTDNGDSGGEVTLVAGPLSSDYKIIIQRLLSYTQETDLVPNDPFSADSVEDALDKLTMLTQQLKEELDRALLGSITTEDGVIAIGYDSGLPTIGATDADKLVQVNAGASDYELTAVGTAVQSTIDTSIDLHSFTEKTTLANDDEFWLADSADSNTNKRVLYSTLASYITSTSKFQVFTASGTFTAPVGVTKVYISGCGAGGSGGGGANAPSTGCGGGGACGQSIANYPYTVVAGNSYTVTLNAGGASVKRTAAGNAGGTSVFDSLTIYGGAGGAAGTGSGGAGGAASILRQGIGVSGEAGAAATDGGDGAGGMFGIGGLGGASGGANGAAGTGYGCGGGGGSGSCNSDAEGNSGAGQKGIIIVSW